MQYHTLYRPVGLPFLDSQRPWVFWETKESAQRDFPDNDEIKCYNDDDIESYCEEHDITTKDIEVYT